MSDKDNALMIFNKPGQTGQPFKFNFHTGDVGHTFIFAPPREGMSVSPLRLTQAEIDKIRGDGQ